MDATRLRAELSTDERRCKKIYTDTVGKITGGVGRNLTDRGFSDDEIDLMLSNDIASTERDLDRALPWWRKLNDARQNVVANMCFNMGIVRLLTFVNTLALVQAGQYSAAAAEMLNSRWALQVGDRAKRLSDRMKRGEF